MQQRRRRVCLLALKMRQGGDELLLYTNAKLPLATCRVPGGGMGWLLRGAAQRGGRIFMKKTALRFIFIGSEEPEK